MTTTAPMPAASGTTRATDLLRQYQAVRAHTEALVAPLSAEDCTTQSMPDASPTKWHLAHTSWFFETLVLEANVPGYAHFHAAFRVLYNSYYNSIGQQHPRAARGLITRPSLENVLAYRTHVDKAIEAYLTSGDQIPDQVAATVEVGLHHEQQHQELILTDVKHLLSQNPLCPVYRSDNTQGDRAAPALEWLEYNEGLVWIGHDGGAFAYDNERPRHRRFIERFAIGSRLVTNQEFLQFINDGGYRRAEFWLSDGWNRVTSENWSTPLYWHELGGDWHEFTLGGSRPIRLHEPVCHVSYFEADAYARWAGARLPTEVEWEVASEGVGRYGNFVEEGSWHPQPAQPRPGIQQMFGDVWEWTKSGYEPYPGYSPPAGPLGEYNSKFMCSQLVLRGGSCATPASHIRSTYRNFFPPEARWQFSGIRLARDVV